MLPLIVVALRILKLISYIVPIIYAILLLFVVVNVLCFYTVDDTTENYVSFYHNLKNRSGLRNSYKIYYIRNPRCGACISFDDSYRNQMYFMNNMVNSNVESYIIDSSSPNFRQILQSYPGLNSLTIRTTPYVVAYKNNDFALPYIINEDQRDDMFTYLYAWDESTYDLEQSYYKSIEDNLFQKANSDAFRKATLLNNYVGVDQNSKYYKYYDHRRSRSASHPRRSRNHRGPSRRRSRFFSRY